MNHARMNLFLLDGCIAVCDGLHERGEKCEPKVLDLKETYDLLESMQKELAMKDGRIKLLEDANRRANEAIGAQADEFSEMLDRLGAGSKFR
jgi:hypothetical protein